MGDAPSQAGFWRRCLSTYAYKITTMVLGLAYTVVSVRMLGAEGRGWLASALAIASIGNGVANLGLGAANTFYSVKRPGSLPGLVGNSLVVSLGAGSLFWVGVALFKRLCPSFVILPGLFLWLLGPMVIAQLIFVCMQGIMVGVGDLRSYNRQELVMRVLVLVACVGMACCGWVSAGKFFAVYALVLAVVSAWACWSCCRWCQAAPRVSWDLLGICSRYSLKSYIISVINIVVLNCDLLLVQHMLSTAQAGIFNVAGCVRNTIALGVGVVTTLVMPELTRLSGWSERMAYAWKVIRYESLALVVIDLIVLLVGEPAVVLVFGEEFRQCLPALYASLPGIVFSGVFFTLACVMNAAGIPKSTFIPYTLGLVVELVLLVVLIPRWGLLGCGWAYSSFQLVQMLAVILLTRHCAKSSKRGSGAVE